MRTSISNVRGNVFKEIVTKHTIEIFKKGTLRPRNTIYSRITLDFKPYNMRHNFILKL